MKCVIKFKGIINDNSYLLLNKLNSTIATHDCVIYNSILRTVNELHFTVDHGKNDTCHVCKIYLHKNKPPIDEGLSFNVLLHDNSTIITNILIHLINNKILTKLYI